MKWTIAIAACLWLALPLAAQRASAAHTPVSFERFDSQLAPFGNWHSSTTLGRVWIPRVALPVGWHPYAYGHWVYTDLGWTWVSDYEWGEIPYHYGTWALEPELGWVWVPGTVWAPSWVVFRSGKRYVGWAPVPPSFAIGSTFAFDDYGPDHFVFVRGADFLSRDLHRQAVPRERSRVVFGDTHVVERIAIENGLVVNRGLDVQRVERLARAPAERAPIERVFVDPDQIESGRVPAATPVLRE